MTGEAKPGPHEQKVLDAFDTERGGSGFEWTSYEQLSPDGEHVLGVLAFLICPVCCAMVPMTPEDIDFPADLAWEPRHKQHHIDVARWQDEVDQKIWSVP